MTQLSLLETSQGSKWETRDFEGYHQFREIPPGCKPSRWKFYIYSFGENDCSVMMTDQTRSRVPIDSKNRITINGKKYGPQHWDH